MGRNEDELPTYVLLVDVFGLILAVIGFSMAFRQGFARRFIGRPPKPASSVDESDDPLTYILRIGGVMMMVFGVAIGGMRSEEHTSELQSLMRISYAVFCLKKKTQMIQQPNSISNVVCT